MGWLHHDNDEGWNDGPYLSADYRLRMYKEAWDKGYLAAKESKSIEENPYRSDVWKGKIP